VLSKVIVWFCKSYLKLLHAFVCVISSYCMVLCVLSKVIAWFCVCYLKLLHAFVCVI